MEVRSFSDLVVKLVICSLSEVDTHTDTDTSISEKNKEVKKIVNEVKEIVNSKFADKNDNSILNKFLKETEKYAFNFEEALQDKLENDGKFRCILE